MTANKKRVAVVGGGMAGIVAAIAAADSGCRVTLIEKERLGGNSMKATSGINAAETEPQRAINVTDTVESFADDIVKSGQGETVPELAMTLAKFSNQAVLFLKKRGLDLGDVEFMGGHSAPRVHRIKVAAGEPPKPIGFTIVKALIEYIEGHPYIEVIEKAEVTDLVFNERGFVTSVHYRKVKDADVPVTAVVLASGGFAADFGEGSLVQKYAPLAAKQGTTNGAFSTGDMQKLADRWGAKLTQMENVQFHPTAFINPEAASERTHFLCPEVVRGCGAVLVNREGRRFVNELLRRDQVAGAILQEGAGGTAWGLLGGDEKKIAALLFNEASMERIGAGTVGFYTSKGFISEVDSVAEAAEKLHLPEEQLRATLEDYAAAAKGEKPDPTEKTVFPEVLSPDAKLYVAFVTPALHYTMGGFEIDTDARVSRQDGSKMLNVFAAGEVAGGLHGKNRLGGNGLLDSLVFGRIAGERAAAVE